MRNKKLISFVMVFAVAGLCIVQSIGQYPDEYVVFPENKLFPFSVNSSDTSTVSLNSWASLLMCCGNNKIGNSSKTNSIDFFIIIRFIINKKVKLLRIGYLIFVLVFITKAKNKRLQ